MARHVRKRKCKHCKGFFAPDHRNVGRQRYCFQPPCRKASKAASQRQWLQKPENRDHFRGPINVERVRQWRKTHPGYWRRKNSQMPDALQDTLTPQNMANQSVERGLARDALQDSFFMQPTVLVGLIAHFTGLSLQDDIELTARRLQQLGRDILTRTPHATGDPQHAQTTHLFTQAPQSPETVQLGGSALGP
jgi:hypothetical protein